MSKRYAILGLSVVLALALAVPALGGPGNPIASISSSVKSTANKALKQAKQAKKLANTANGNATKAQEAASNAQLSANGAQSTAGGAKKIAEEAKAEAEAANANANSRIEGSYFNFGEASEENTTTTKFAGAECDSASDPILGGGFFVGGSGNNDVTVTGSEIDPIYGDSWFVSAEAISGTPSWSLQASILCGFK